MTATNKVASAASMSVPTVGQKRLVIVGATGMVGGYALRYALDNSAVKSVTSIGRKKLGISHPKLKEVLHHNFADCSPLADVLLGRTRRSIAWGRTLGQCQTQNSAPQPPTTRSSSREFSITAVRMPCSRF